MVNAVLALACCCVLQTPQPPDLVVRGFGITLVGSAVLTTPRPADVTDVDPNPLGGPSSGTRHKVTTKLRDEPMAYLQLSNTGSRTIRRVGWALAYYADKGRSRTRLVFRFDEAAQIRSGETGVVVATARRRAPTRYCELSIVRVEYDDGTAWTAKPTEPKRRERGGRRTSGATRPYERLDRSRRKQMLQRRPVGLRRPGEPGRSAVHHGFIGVS